METTRPYLVIPKLVAQPTWGGTYIASYKNWQTRFGLSEIKIGQSYELYKDTVLSLECTDSANPTFQPELTSPPPQATPLATLVEKSPADVLGKTYVTRFGKEMTILIKFTQALGNSFQLHRRPSQAHGHWIPKAESWYFFEPGTLTYGIKPGADMTDYKSTCIKINTFMNNLSAQVVAGTLALPQAKEKAHVFITQRDPWQYINLHHVPAGTIVDLSGGGIHHSWEADNSLTSGNIVYEVQQNVMDDNCTIRSFDQGKIKDDGTIRTIHIDDYFACLDTDPIKNDITFAEKKPSGATLFDTPYYSMDELTLTASETVATGGSFAHLFVKEGQVTVTAGDTTITVNRGHSVFVPQAAKSYVLSPQKENTVLLKTYIR